MPPVRRLAAILAADVAGYSRLMGADEEGTHERLKAHLGELVNPKIEEHRGRIVKNTGDGFLAEFSSVVDAMRCAAEVQRAMIDREPEVPDQQRISFRIGINLGDVIVEEHDIFGDGVNVAARLEALAEPGGICVSATVRDHIGDRLPYAFEDMGEQSVKNIARPVRAFALRPDGLAALSRPGLSARPAWRHQFIFGVAATAAIIIVGITWWFWPTPPFLSRAGKPTDQATVSATPMLAAPAATSISQPLVAPRLSIVVLPFVNLSSHPDQQFFVDGITEDLTTNLSRLPDMFVISRNTAFTYQGKRVDSKQIGRELGVRYVLEGSVQRSGNRVRITAQLIDAETDAHLWADRFERDTGDLFALQNEITIRLASALGVELITAEATRATEHPDALDYILRGRAALNRTPTRENYTEVIGLFERALALDPQSVEVQSQLAMALVGRVLDEMAPSRAADLERAEGLIGQALAASPRNPLTHYAKAQLLRATGRCEEAIPEFETALASNPNLVSAIANVGRCKIYVGPIEEAIPLLERAIRLSPRDPLIGNWCFRIGQAHLAQSRIGDAIIWLEKARSAGPTYPYVHRWLASAYGIKGDFEHAAAELAEARRLSGNGSPSSISKLRPEMKTFVLPAIRDLFENTYLVGLRKAGLPEE